MATDLELAVIAAGHTLQESEFGRSLQQYHPGRRGGDDPGVGGLRSYEVNDAPAIRRTLHVLELHERLGEELDTSGDEDYLEFVRHALTAVRRIAVKCWAPIPQDLRMLIFDQDDLGAAVSHYIPSCRTDHAGPSLKFQGLDQDPVRSHLRDLISQAKRTPAFAAAERAAATLSGIQDSARTERERIVDRLKRSEGVATFGEVAERWRRVCEAAYSGVEEPLAWAALAIRGYNELVQNVLWALLGMAEEIEPLTLFDTDLGTIRVRQGPRRTHVTMTLRDAPFFGHPPSPFELGANLPIDGLYLSDRSLVQFGGELFIDVSGSRLGALEQALPA